MDGKDAIKQIRIVVDQYGLWLKYLLLGPLGLERKELKELFRSGLIDPEQIGPSLSEAYMEALFDQLNVPSRKHVRDHAIRHLNRRAGVYIDKWIDRVKSDYEGIVLSELIGHRQRKRDLLREELPRALTDRLTVKELASKLASRTESFGHDWERIVNTELAEAHNLGAVDAIIENNRDKTHDEIYVYKVGPHDGKECDACRRFWFLDDGITPRVYKLSELLANGSNVGRKQKDWLPTVSSTHPNERHFLMELPRGFGFEQGKLEWVKRDHVEYERQQGDGDV